MILAESHVLLTGAAGSLGSVIATSLHQKGAQLSLVDYREEALSRLDLPAVQKYSCDQTQPAAVANLVEQLQAAVNFPNVVINNAGIIHSEPLVSLLKQPDSKHDLENWRKVMDINLNAVFYLSAAMIEEWLKRRMPGLIINISSIAAQGNTGQSAYAASKAGVEALTKAWSKELGMFKIRCAGIAPGFIDTPSTQQSLTNNMQEKWKKSIPLNRFGQAQEIASAIAFIIENDYFNGKILPLDGGLSI